jgi:hypothetical protein
MIRFRKEGETVENGINLYPINDKSSFGFIFRFGKKIPHSHYRESAFFFRYSKNSKRWWIFTTNINSEKE